MCILTRPVIVDQQPKPPTPAPVPARRWVRWLCVVLVATLLVFSHGCHGDEDNELSAGNWWVTW